MKKKETIPEPFWDAQVKIFFDFYIENFHTEPEFKGTRNPSFLKEIIGSLKRRAEKNNIEWTEEVACKRLLSFFQHAMCHDLLRKCYNLKTINTYKDLVFQKIANNGNQTRITENPNGRTGTSEARINALKGWGQTRRSVTG